MNNQPPLKLWQIIVTILGALLPMWVVAGMMFQDAANQGLR